MPNNHSHPQIIDYEGGSYKQDFWDGQGREFEDLAERYALQKLLPPDGRVLIELGAGFGRLAGLYKHYDKVVLIDYSLSLLLQAKEQLGSNPKFQFIAASIYDLPLVDNLADVIVMVRVAHHLESIELAFREIARVLQGQKTFVFEYANKRNAKAIVRYILRKQHWSPFEQAPYEFVPLNFDFHPSWMAERLHEAGFVIRDELAISHFRLPSVKRHVSAKLLARIDSALSRPDSLLKLSPSILVKSTSDKAVLSANGFLRCPHCGSSALENVENAVKCTQCGQSWPIVEGIIDFRYPRPERSQA